MPMIAATQRSRDNEAWRAVLRREYGTKKATPSGVIIYEGPSTWDGKPIVVIVTGLRDPSDNDKTGDKLQSFVLLQDEAPNAAIRNGTDVSVCGGCNHRSVASGGTGSCYVVTYQGPRSVWAAYKRGAYPHVKDPAFFAGADVRFGAYGDPAMVPVSVWLEMLPHLKKWTGYTHQWATMDLGNLWHFLHASVDSVEEQRDASARGWGTFRVKKPGEPDLPEERQCAADARGVACVACPFPCNGDAAHPTTIEAHGATAKYFEAA